MRLLTAILCFLYLSFTSASNFHVTVMFKCNFGQIPFSGTVYLMEWDDVYDDELSKETFDPSTAISHNSHNITMKGHASEFSFLCCQHPYISFRHNCHPQAKVQEYKIHLNECPSKAANCRYLVGVSLGVTNSYYPRDFEWSG